MSARLSLITIGLLGSLLASAALAQDVGAPSVSWEKPTQKLQAATVMVRILCEKKLDLENGDSANPQPQPDAKSKDQKRPCTIVVCSGLCVAPNKFVTAVQVGTDSQIRFTFPGGSQGDARLRVIDEFSGLVLLESKSEAATPIEFAAAPSAAGSWVMTGSAWGVEKPIVSLGIVGAVDRMLTGGSYPPLLQCDVRTTDTSCGAGVVNSQGKLVGVVIGADKAQWQRGWAYVVPVSHVERLLRVAATAKSAGKEDDKSVVVLKRRRPIVGMQLDGDADGGIIVRRLTAGGPAEKAGLKIGDRVTATDGIRIRSVYQATVPTLHKQPGDTVTFRIDRDGKSQEIQVTLGGGLELSSLPADQLAEIIQPKVELRRHPQRGYFRPQNGEDSPAVFLPAGEKSGGSKAAGTATAESKIAVLEKAMDRYQKVIELQQQQLKQSSSDRARLEESVDGLKAEMEALRRQLQSAQPPKKTDAPEEGSKK